VLIKKLEKMNSSKDKLFSLISHDLRSPFNSLLGFSEILTKEYDSLTNEEIKEYIKAIYDSSKNLYGMTNNLLQFSRFQLGKIGFKPKVIELQKTVNAVLTMLKGNILKKQINVESTVPVNTFVYADEDMLNSIFQNLVSNAIKFTYKKGEIKITSEIITENEKDFVLIGVEDSGIGISDIDVKRILEGDTFTTPGTQKEFGTGLGLQLVKEFIKKNGGALQIKTKLNMGSTFTFTIPFSK
jgi:signal transduction histidine kinase